MIKIKFSKKELNLFKPNWWSNTQEEWTPKLLLENRKKWPSQVNPDGKPWKALTPAYAKWKSDRYGSLPILRLTGRMLDTAVLKPDGNRIVVESTEPGAYHQFGTKRMVARPWMGVPDTSLKILAELAWKNILK